MDIDKIRSLHLTLRAFQDELDEIMVAIAVRRYLIENVGDMKGAITRSLEKALRRSKFLYQRMDATQQAINEAH